MGEPADERWDRDNRQETETERMDRNWSELLQELRVTQTGVQLLTGFLLSLPFQQRFSRISSGDRIVYLTVVALSVTATLLLLAPVSMHRIVFRQHEKRELVGVGNLMARAGLVALALAMSGVSVLIFDVAVSGAAGLAAGLVVLAALTVLWLAMPLVLRRRYASRIGRAHR